eukprot:CAMPEP_0181136338 /NCGR_PEP_ID=MMETSP1071-20121207/33126_1 /TAXON_ID=35127 /ORGANISM="Thalassiosira sp., Strain NH16" /LENGTH=450 /DNA_ID=CAMNT_0023223033 /DNA_START=126 /DNA_END=1475 /DNA_ORIENTATION=-
MATIEATAQSSSLEPLAILSPKTLTGSPAWSATFSIDGKYLAVCFGNPDSHIKVWEHQISSSRSMSEMHKIQSNQQSREWKLIATIRDEHTRTIRSVAFAPTPSTLSVPILASASFDGKVLIWEYYPDNENKITAVGGSSNTNSYDETALENNDAFEPIAQLEGHENEIKCLAWNTTGSLLASCGRDKTIWIWEFFLPGTIGGNESMTAEYSRAEGDADQGGEFECLAVLQGHDGDVKSIVFGPSHSQWGEGEEVLFSASYDNSIKVWAEESGDWYCAATLGASDSLPQSMPTVETGGAVHASTIWSLGLSPGGVRLFSGSDDGSMAIWKMYTAAERKILFPRASDIVACSTDGLWKCVGKLPDAHSSYAIFSIACAPSRAGHGRIVSGGGDNCINIYREEATPADGGSSSDAPKFALEAVADDAHDGDVNCVKWHPMDGTCLVSCGDDG